MAKVFVKFKPVQKRFDSLAKKHENLREFWPDIAKPILQQEVTEIFNRRGIPRWAKRKPQPETHPLLERTGTLRRSWTIARRKGNVLRFRKDAIIFGTTLPYAQFLEYGTRHMPARPILQTLLKTRRGSRKSLGGKMTEALSEYLQRVDRSI